MMVTTDDSKSCVKCQKAVKSTEKAIVCGLWCRKFFHNDCVGLSNSETRVVTCSKERIKFHCEICENRLVNELSVERETYEPNPLDTCVNNCLLDLVKKILKLTNELSNGNSVINTKLDTVISSNAKLEEYMSQSPKCYEKRGEETTDNNVVYVQSFSATRTTEISEENDTNSDNPTVNSKQMCCTSKPQQIDDSSSLQQLSDSQQPNDVEDCSSYCLQEWEVPGHHNNMQDPLATNEEELEVCDDHNDTQDPLNTDREECSPSEDFRAHSDFGTSIEKTVCEGGEKAENEIDKEECPSSEDFLDCNTFSIVKTEYDEDGEAVGEGSLEELKHEVESACSGSEPESTIVCGMEDNRNKDDSSSLVTKVSRAAGKSPRIPSTNKEEVSCGGKSVRGCVVHSCDNCKKTFTNLQALMEHTSLSRCQLRHSCKMCHKTFMCGSSLEKHFQMHMEESQIVCDIGNKTFTHENIREQHSQLHSRYHPYSCSVCNKTFTNKSNLKRHLLLHTDERPYSCSVCSKTFRQKDTLQQHFLLHTGERPYSCSVCSKTFSDRRNLKHHSVIHSSERPYSCSLCSKTFRKKVTLQQHLRRHTGERPYSCSICSKTFTRNSTLKRHLKLHSG